MYSLNKDLDTKILNKYLNILFFQQLTSMIQETKKIPPPVTFFKSENIQDNTKSSVLESNKHDDLYVNSGGF